MLLSESYKNRLKKLSGLLVCDNCYHSWEKEKKDADPNLCHVCGFDSEQGQFRIEDLKEWMVKKYGSLEVAWDKKYKNSINENVGPGPNDTTPASDIYMDIFNQIFVPKDFKRSYNPDDEDFWFQSDYDLKVQRGYSEKKDETADEGDLDKEGVKGIDKKYQKLKRAYNWKNFQKLGGN
jgi:hypothetical protein